MLTVTKKKRKPSTLTKLKNLLRVMEEVRDDPCKSFSWASWGRRLEGEAKKREGLFIEDAPNFCGTQACVIGWACLDPWFKKNGLKGRIVRVASDISNIKVPGIHFGRLDIEKYFGLGREEFDDLLYGRGDVDDAIRLIQKLIKKRTRKRGAA